MLLFPRLLIGCAIARRIEVLGSRPVLAIVPVGHLVVRVVLGLAHLAEHEGKDGDDGSIRLAKTRADLAERLGISIEEIGTSSLQSRAFAGLANRTFIFCLPGSTSACRTAWENIIRAQLDARTRPCNLANLRPRLGARD